MFSVASLGIAQGMQFPAGENSEVVDKIGKEESAYLLLDKSLQFRITENVNALYNFEFDKAESGISCYAIPISRTSFTLFFNGIEYMVENCS
jgi:hypothetical protein